MIAVASGGQAPACDRKSNPWGSAPWGIVVPVTDEFVRQVEERLAKFSTSGNLWPGNHVAPRDIIVSLLAGYRKLQRQVRNDPWRLKARGLQRQATTQAAELRAQGAVIELLKLKEQLALRRAESAERHAVALQTLAERKAHDGQVLAANLKAAHEELARVEKERDEARDLLKLADERLQTMTLRLEAATAAPIEPESVPATEPF